ncbi:BEL1-like homeodomain protein 2 [Sesamum angolense]|uniref:BEL1-like homeodomain protein 2 n=1 Tax=Sesamum angolense TaxID=2727404 RepID=A0AAE1WHD9_9LAMI|nr:BEL1-like homeodomain protein 2 [Sesamum angolense]
MDMGIATPTLLPSVTSHSKGHNSLQYLDKQNFPNSMSQDYHQSIFSFSNGFERSQQEQQQQQHIAQQIRRDKLRVQGFQPPVPPLVGIEGEESGELPVYETAGMLSEMFNFPSGVAATATELLENQILQSYRNPRATPPSGGASTADWFPHRQGMVVGGTNLGDSKNQTAVNDTASHHHHQQQQHQISSINADSAAAMQLFLMNPQQQRSPSPSPSHPPPSTSSTLHMLLPNPSSSSTLQAFQNPSAGAFGQFTWVPNSGNENNPNEIPGVVECQGLSLSLSSSLQHLEAAKAEELGMGEGGMLFFGQGGGSTPPQYQFKNFGGSGGGALHLQGGAVSHNHQLHVGLGSSLGTVNMLRNSKYAKAAQELLEEFCSVGRGQFKKNKFWKQNNNNGNPSSNPSAGATSGAGAGGGNSSSSSKDNPPLSAADRLEHQRRKVDRRYNHYCEQMQMVVNSFDMVMGFGAAVPYTCLAQKAMSRHFRCLKDAIAAQLKHSCELLEKKDAGTSGVTKGETPRLRILEQSLRQQRAFHQMGMMEQEAWRPQRGLPERSVNILRAWLFEHFLHPFQTGSLMPGYVCGNPWSRKCTSKKPKTRLYPLNKTGTKAAPLHKLQRIMPIPLPLPPPPPPPQLLPRQPKDPKSMPPKTTLHSSQLINQSFSDNQPKLHHHHSTANVSLPPASAASQSFPVVHPSNDGIHESTLIRFGTNAGDVSLTLGLRHAGNLPEKSPFSVRDFGGC